MINIKPSSALRNKYAEISKYCKETGEPVYITNNGEGDLVVMDIEAFEEATYSPYEFAEAERAYMPMILEGLADAQRRRDNGEKGYTAEETLAMLKKIIDRINDEV